MPASPDGLFLKACRLEEVPRPPVWMMRQAGRYLPEYREVRSGASFLDMCRDPKLAAEVTLQPIRRYDFDAAVIFSDIMLPLIAMGAPFEFAEGGPKMPEGYSTPQQLRGLREVEDIPRELPWTLEAIARVREELDPGKSVLGFAGAPFTLLCYLVEGGGSRHYPDTKRLMFDEPALAEETLGRLADLVGRYLVAQFEAGASAVQLFDTWAGLLAPEDFERFAMPFARRALAPAIERGIPTIYYVNGGPSLLPMQLESGCSVVGVDWRLRMREVRAMVPEDRGIQGNLDPLVLLAEPSVVRERTAAMLEEMRGRRGYIVNLGHGVIPQTRVDSVAAFVETVRAFES